MNVFVRLLGNLSIVLQRAGERVKIERYKARFAKCGNNVSIDSNCVFIPEHISIGDNVSIGHGCCFLASIAQITIGNNVIFAPGVVIRGGDHRHDIVGKYMFDISDNEKLPENDKDVVIEDDVWIG